LRLINGSLMKDKILKAIPLTVQIGNSFKAQFYQNWGFLLDSGFSINESLKMLEDSSSKAVADELGIIGDSLDKGRELSSLLESSELFENIETSFLQIGLDTGNVKEAVSNLEDFFRSKDELKRILIDSLIYPIMVLLLAIAIVIFLLVFMVPMFEQTFARSGGELPYLTQVVVGTSDWVVKFGVYLFLVIVLFMAWVKFVANKEAKTRVRNLISRIPIVRHQRNERFKLHFYHQFSILLKEKIGLIKAFKLVKKIDPDPIYIGPIDVITRRIQLGSSLEQAMRVSKLFSEHELKIIHLGEESHKLDLVFQNLYSVNLNKLKSRSHRIGKIIEPALIVIVGILVGVIMLAMYLPLFNLNQGIL